MHRGRHTIWALTRTTERTGGLTYTALSEATMISGSRFMMTLLVDRGRLGPLFVDSKLIDALDDRRRNFAKLKRPREIHTTKIVYSTV